MNNLWEISTIKDILMRHGFSFSKSLGQNFLINPSVCPKMAENAVTGDNTGVLEIGPGIGVLTNELCLRAKKVVSVELDKRLVPVLTETMAEHKNFKLIQGDILKTNIKKLIAEEFEGMDVAVCANLPYYITSPVIMGLLEENLSIESITVMVQKEAADRICAKVGTRESGAITTAVNYYCTPQLLFKVSRGSFMPAPNVDSAVIKLNIRKTPAVNVKSEKMFFKTVRAGFSQRRKTILNSLSSALQIDKETVREVLVKAEIKENARAEKLSLDDFAKISDALLEISEKEKVCSDEN